MGRRKEKLQTLTLSLLLGGPSLGGPLGADAVCGDAVLERERGEGGGCGGRLAQRPPGRGGGASAEFCTIQIAHTLLRCFESHGIRIGVDGVGVSESGLVPPGPPTEPGNPETPKVHFKVRNMPFLWLGSKMAFFGL